MNYNFLNVFLDKKDLLKQESSCIDEFLLQNNTSNIENIYKFYEGKTNILCVNGFLGTGKLSVVKYSQSFLSVDTIVFNYTCFQSTILDDILLHFFIEFKKLFSLKKIEEPKFRSENFAQKINTYFLRIEKPFVIVINSFNDVQKSNRQEIFDFISHLSDLEKVKIIIISNSFPEEIDGKDLKYEDITTLPLNDSIFEKYLKSEKIKYNNASLEKFYDYTRGYAFYTKLAVSFIKFTNDTLDSFFEKIQKSFMSFDRFMEKNAVEMVPLTSRNLYWFIALIRHGVSVDLLKKTGLYDEEVVNLLIDRQVLINENENIYVRDYFRENLDVSVAVNIAQKIHQYIVNLYEVQLPLKPLERDIPVSRQTMRQEIEYHKLFLPKKPRILENQEGSANFLAYAKSFEFDSAKMWSDADKKDSPKLDKRFLKMKEEKEKREREAKESGGDGFNRVKNPNLNLSNMAINTGAINSREIEQPDSEFAPKAAADDALAQKRQDISLKEILFQAKSAEETYRYNQALELYLTALKRARTSQPHKNVAEIYSKIALCYQKLSNNEEALKNLYLALDLFSDAGEIPRANAIKLKISRLLYETYKFELARDYAMAIINAKDIPPILMIKAYIQLSYIEEGLSDTEEAYKYIKIAISEANEAMDSDVLAELYFKYALFLDDKENYEEAINYYEKCAFVNSNPETNQFLSSAYSNIAALYYERGNAEKAVENYQKAYKIDSEKENYDGIYYSSSKLAQLLQRKNPDLALEYYISAVEASKNLKDLFTVASAELSLGDFYYNRRENKLALQEYLDVLEIAEKHFSPQNKARVEMRINDLKVKMGEPAFNLALKELKKGENN